MLVYRGLSAYCLICLILAHAAAGQIRYAGRISTAPISLTLLDDGAGTVAGVYTYARFDTPIALDGTLRQGMLRVTERNRRGNATATLTIPGFAMACKTAQGTWKILATGQQLPLTLTSLSAADASEPDATLNQHGLLQDESLPNCNFEIVLAGEPAGYGSEVTAVRLLEKKTRRLVQQVPVSCQSHGLRSVGVGDFNFDGYPDFSVFESSYAGPNTTSLYFLYDPATKRYVDSGFTGTSLEFDEQKKRIYEHNSCCAGTSVTSAEYRVLHNRMVLVAQHCYRWDDKKQALVERKPSACQ